MACQSSKYLVENNLYQGKGHSRILLGIKFVWSNWPPSPNNVLMSQITSAVNWFRRQNFFSPWFFKKSEKQTTGWVQKNGPPSFRSSDHNFALIASIIFNELFIMNLSFKGGTVHLNRSIRIEITHQNVFSVRSQLLRFWTKFKGLRICILSELIFDLRGSQH